MGEGHPGDGALTQHAEQSTGCSSGCFSNCPTCRRLRKAAAECAVRHGVETITSEAIAEFAAVPLERAVEHYPTLDDCLAATYDEGALRLRRVCVPALRGRGTWPDRLHAAVDAAIEEFKSRPDLARFCMMVALRCDLPLLRAASAAARERFVAILAEERGPAVDELELPGLRFEMLAGAAWHVVNDELGGEGRGRAVRERLDEVIEVFEPASEPAV